jgi:hypothetical protein
MIDPVVVSVKLVVAQFHGVPDVALRITCDPVISRVLARLPPATTDSAVMVCPELVSDPVVRVIVAELVNASAST